MNEKEILEIAKMIVEISERGEYYNGEGSTTITEWLEEGDVEYIKSASIEELAAEWDE